MDYEHIPNTPKQLVEKLKKSIVGQDSYLQDLCTCVWMHSMRKDNMETDVTSFYPKSNMLVLGKSGTGKTSAIQALAKELSLNVVIEDASMFTGTGWKGRDVAAIIKDVLNSTSDRFAANFTIVVLDEIDKVFGRYEQNSFSATNSLLKMMEGGEIRYEEGREMYMMNTNNLLFICLGAFDGLEKIVEKRQNKDRKIGFCVEEEVKNAGNIFSHVTKEDLVAYGTNTQFLGRISMITATNELKAADYEHILTSSKTSVIRQYDDFLYKSLEVHASITKAAVKQIAQRALKAGTGARELKYEVTKGLRDGLYLVAEDKTIRELQLDYLPQEDRLYVNCIKGKEVREHLHEKERSSQEESWEEIPLEIECYNTDNTLRYAEYIVEHSQITGDKFFEFYSYGNIKAATYLLAAIILRMIISDKDLLLGVVKQELHYVSQAVTSGEVGWETMFIGDSMNLYQKSQQFEWDLPLVIMLADKLLKKYYLYLLKEKRLRSEETEN